MMSCRVAKITCRLRKNPERGCAVCMRAAAIGENFEELKMSWETLRLGEFLTLKRGYGLSSDQREAGDVPIVSSAGITGYHSVAKVEGPGVVTGRYGTLGKVFFINEDYWPLNTALYVQDFKGNNPRFTAYFLESILTATSGDKAAVPGVNRNDLHARTVRVTRDIGQQTEIASILSAYDDLIENNRRRIQLLEQAARLIYKEWFVRLRFPDHEHVKVRDGVPEGWERKSLGEVAVVRKGKNITKGSVKGGSVPVVAGGLTPAYYHNTANVDGPVITVSASGANAGYVNLYHEDIWASDCSYISRRSTEHLYYLYLLLRSKQKEISGFQKGAAQPHVYPKDLQRLPLLVPKDTVLELFEKFVAPNFRQMGGLHKQNKRLSQVRDLLLPRLMNGERVSHSYLGGLTDVS